MRSGWFLTCICVMITLAACSRESLTAAFSPDESGRGLNGTGRCDDERKDLRLPGYTVVDHVLAIDGRGFYRPVKVECDNGQPHRQFRQADVSSPGQHDGLLPCPENICSNPAINIRQVREHIALMAQIDRIIDQLDHPVNGVPQHLVIFIHGGLVSQEESLARAIKDAPDMINDRRAFDPLGSNGGGNGPILMKGSKIFPLFLNWPSGPLDTYGDSVLDYEQGKYSTDRHRHLEAPIYVATDAADIFAHAPLDLVKSIHRFFGAHHLFTNVETSCQIDPHFGCDDMGKGLERPLLDTVVYGGTFPLRGLTVPMLDVGTRAWKNMVARTRFGVEKYVRPNDYENVFLTLHPDVTKNQRADFQKQKEIMTQGVFYHLFARLREKFYAGGHLCDGTQPRITLIGHSMGTMVANELLHAFPDLPYENIVFMAAAANIRDFQSMTEPVLRHPACPQDLRFYNLSLHQDADRDSLEYRGALPRGSLLEWIDDIFETPVTSIDRTMGKWENVLFAQYGFAPDARRRMFFHRFGLVAPDPIMHGDFAGQPREISDPGARKCETWRYWQPQYWAGIRVLTDTDCATVRWMTDIESATHG